jgi:23S rRNA pseudouridine1911/1915/1917 synthase
MNKIVQYIIKITSLFPKNQMLFYATLQALLTIQMIKEDTLLEVKENTLLMEFLIQNLKNKNRDNIKSLLRNKQVWVNGEVISQFNQPLLPGQQVVIKWARATNIPPNRYLSIVYEDEYLIVIDKKAGLLSISAGNEDVTAFSLLSIYVRQQNPANKIFVVHRLDRYTSGLMMFAKSEKAQSILRNDWKSFISERTYTAIVEGAVKEPEGEISSYLSENKAFVMLSSQDPTKGKLAITHFRTLKSNKDFSLLEVNLETGKKNQIRVHMQNIGHSIAGDKKYGASYNPIGRLGLHASVLAFLHPITGESLRFESNIPARFLRLF